MMQEDFMRRCFEIALLGIGYTSPNPMVGACLVYNGRIIGEGYHQKHGGAHAEVNAVQSVKPEDHHLISKSTLFVSLEPCCVHGRTPPCTNLIIDQKIPKVVVSTLDLSPEVAGNGIKLLRDHGVEVTTGILEDVGKQVAASRHAIVTQNRPYIILKYAQSANGKMGLPDKQVWFTNPFSKILVHKWRSEADGILVGAKTVLTDNPQLTTREYFGKSPKKIVLDPRGTLPFSKKVFDKSTGTIRIIDVSQETTQAADYIKDIEMDFNDSNFLPQLLSKLTEEKIGILLVEGGAKTLLTFINNGLWDEARVFTTKKVLKDGIDAPAMPKEVDESFQILNDRLDYYYNR